MYSYHLRISYTKRTETKHLSGIMCQTYDKTTKFYTTCYGIHIKSLLYRNKTKMSLKSSYQVPIIFSKYTNSFVLVYLQTRYKHLIYYTYIPYIPFTSLNNLIKMRNEVNFEDNPVFTAMQFIWI